MTQEQVFALRAEAAGEVTPAAPPEPLTDEDAADQDEEAER